MFNNHILPCMNFALHGKMWVPFQTFSGNIYLNVCGYTKKSFVKRILILRSTEKSLIPPYKLYTIVTISVGNHDIIIQSSMYITISCFFLFCFLNYQISTVIWQQSRSSTDTSALFSFIIKEFISSLESELTTYNIPRW